jgi:hypothetical protein
MVLISVYILGFGLGKNIKKREEDKVVYIQIAEYISGLEKPDHKFVPVLTSDSSLLKLVPFYLNLSLSAGFCPADSVPVIKTNEDLFQYVREKNVKYFLWDEKSWQNTRVDIRSDDFRRNFDDLGQWYDRYYGDIILFGRK